MKPKPMSMVLCMRMRSMRILEVQSCDGQQLDRGRTIPVHEIRDLIKSRSKVTRGFIVVELDIWWSV